MYLLYSVRLEEYKSPTRNPAETGSPATNLAPSSPDMDDGSSKRQATRLEIYYTIIGTVCNVSVIGYSKRVHQMERLV